MRQDYTHITMVVDRSGSMTSIKDDAEGGINSFIQDQAKEEGKCSVTLVQFDNKYDFVERMTDASEVSPYILRPRGGTAMYDAIGRAIVETGEALRDMPEQDRPALVLFVIVTDGEENASVEFKGEQVRKMLKQQEDEFSWKFTFLAANIDAFTAGQVIGVGGNSIMSYAGCKSQAAYSGASESILRVRSMTRNGLRASNVELVYTDEERRAAK